MRRGQRRRSATRVKGGRVQRKNNWEPAPSDHRRIEQPFPLVIRERPGLFSQHLLTKRDVYALLELLPDWDELSQGLNAIVLAERDLGADGWHDIGTVAVCAWDEDGPYVEVRWTRPAARAFQLLHILLHELGHHHDRMTTRSRPDIPPRGEPYAEAYARRYEALIWERYLERFGLG